MALLCSRPWGAVEPPMAGQMCARWGFCRWKWVVRNANSLPAEGHAESRAGPGQTRPESRGLL